MKSFLAMCLLFLTGAWFVPEAEAARMGGGKSMGRQESTWSRQAAPGPSAPAAQPRPAADPAMARPAGSRWAGPIAGLVAGGLLGALFFGGAFEGLQMADVLVLVLVLAAVVFFVRRMRRARVQPVPATAQAYAAPAAAAAAGRVAAPTIGSGLGGQAGEARPAWFDEARFLQGAKTHFINLQAAWDRGDLEKLREYVTPELHAELARERAQPGNEAPYTEVVELHAELVSFRTYPDHVLASVRYSGLIREARGAEPQRFVEVWNVQRGMGDARANWYVAGIQQQTDA
ncbi:putative lipid-binding transport protein (Tim44 family) [Plasticicumulans lactativorans]|uniref:Putative lipid-binding transport protein (Tim44 family) n=1 Tax=Plasticicumulans lactativorans TaxID=1133106 RepID=A0A4R2L3N7_9GAMM|nr:Tim44-like domain-containing protein [Plasticicumulans lactativorans]TCO81003.1 putative lipid-binding transport protein (Tim44 family) [Plasticicumulans lactativorans]